MGGFYLGCGLLDAVGYTYVKMVGSWRPELLIKYLAFLLMCFGMSGVSLYWFQRAEAAGVGIDSSTSLLLSNLIFLQFGMLGATWLLVRDHGLTWDQVFGFQFVAPGKILFQAFKVASFGFVVSCLLGMVVHQIFELLGRESSEQAIVELFVQNQGLGQRALICFTALLMAPLVEELLFRGVLYTVLLQYLTRPLALILSSLLFGLVHFHEIGLLPLSALALLLALSYEKSRNLWVPIFAHTFFNLINLGLLLWVPSLD